MKSEMQDINSQLLEKIIARKNREVRNVRKSQKWDINSVLRQKAVIVRFKLAIARKYVFFSFEIGLYIIFHLEFVSEF